MADVTVWSSSATETRAVAAAAAPLLRAGDVIALSGELGAGKTCFVQGLAAALGVAARITSPTFTLVKTYDDGAVPLVHCDVYRLETMQEVLGLGDEVMADDVITCIEWGDAVRAVLPPDRLEVELTLPAPDASDDGGRGRWIRLHGAGRWSGRMGALARACRAGTGGDD